MVRTWKRPSFRMEARLAERAFATNESIHYCRDCKLKTRQQDVRNKKPRQTGLRVHPGRYLKGLREIARQL